MTFVPIGTDCTAAHYLRRKGIRSMAFPFDWTVTPLLSALDLLENRFTDYLSQENLTFLPADNRLLFAENGTDIKISNDIITPVVCQKYGILYPHDFTEAGSADLPDVKEKYDRRIAKLLKLLDRGERLTFVYHIGELNEWQIRQLTAAGQPFIQTTKAEAIARFKSLGLKNADIISLEELKWKQKNWKQRGKAIVKGLLGR